MAKSEFAKDVAPDWKLSNPCKGRWEEFDDGTNVHAAVECWQKCAHRRSCLTESLRIERATPMQGYVEIAGIRGGYTVVERRQIYAFLDEVDGLDPAVL